MHPEGKFVVDIDKNIDINDVTPNCRVALRNDSYTLHKILPNKVSYQKRELHPLLQTHDEARYQFKGKIVCWFSFNRQYCENNCLKFWLLSSDVYF